MTETRRRCHHNASEKEDGRRIREAGSHLLCARENVQEGGYFVCAGEISEIEFWKVISKRGKNAADGCRQGEEAP